MPWLTSFVATFTVTVIFIAMLGGVYGHAAKKIFLGGFAIGTWGFLLLAYGIHEIEHVGNRMVTGIVLDQVGIALFGEAPAYSTYATQDPMENARIDLDIIGHCLFALACGLISGYVAFRFARGGKRPHILAEAQSGPSLESRPHREHHSACSGVNP